MKNLYPVYIDLNDRNCLIVGGGKVAERKIEQLLDYDCSIQVISLGIEDKIKYWAHQGLIQLYQREFTASDLEDVFMVFVATDNNQLNAELS